MYQATFQFNALSILPPFQIFSIELNLGSCHMNKKIALSSLGCRIFLVRCLVLGVSCSARDQGVVVVGGVPLGTSENFLSLWKPTFEKYLTDTVGSNRSPPLQFSLVPVSLTSIFDAVETGKLDFVYANPSLYSCLEAEYSGIKCH